LPEFEGEEDGYIPVSEFDEIEFLLTLVAPPPAPLSPPSPVPSVSRPIVSAPAQSVAQPAQSVVSVPMHQSQHTCIPSQAVHEVLAGHTEGYVPGWLSEPTEGVGSHGESHGEGNGCSVDDEDAAKVEVTVSANEADENVLEYVLAVEVSEVEALEPCTLVEAHMCSDWLLWEKVIHEELNMLCTTGTWVLKEPPAGMNVIGSKWVSKVKKDAAGKVVCYKARLVVQGFSQVPGIDYFDTYAPVLKLSLIWMILAIANHQDMELHQVDIKGVYSTSTET